MTKFQKFNNPKELYMHILSSKSCEFSDILDLNNQIDRLLDTLYEEDPFWDEYDISFLIGEDGTFIAETYINEEPTKFQYDYESALWFEI